MSKITKSIFLLAAFSMVLTGCKKKNKNNKQEPSGENPSGEVTPSGDQGGGGQGGDVTPSGDQGGGGQGGDVTPALLDDAITITVADKVYDGQLIVATATATSGRTATLTYKMGESVLPNAPKDAGNYVVFASIDADTTYNAASASQAFTISQKEVSLIWSEPGDLHYNGSAKTISASVNPATIIDGDVVNVTVELVENTNNVEIGTFGYIATGLSDPNYRLPENRLSPTYEIIKGKIDSQILHLENTITFTETLSLADVTLPDHYSWNLKDDPASPEDESQPLINRIYYVGTYTYPVKFTPEDSAHYDEMYTNVEFAVVRAIPTYDVPATIHANYGDTLRDFDLSAEHFYFEDPLDTTVGNPGTKTFLATYNSGNTNYLAVEHVQITFEVAKADNNILNLKAKNKVYDGSPIETPTFDQLGNGEAHFYYKSIHDADFEEGLPVNCGDYNIKLVVDADSIYKSAEATTTVAINRATGNLKFRDGFKTSYESGETVIVNASSYDFNGDAEVSVSYVLTTAYGGMYASYTDGVPSEDGTYYLKISAPENDNATAASDIIMIEIGRTKPYHSLSITNLDVINKVYDGELAPKPHVSLDGVDYESNVSGGWYWGVRNVNESTWNHVGQVNAAGTYDLMLWAVETETYAYTVIYTQFTIEQAPGTTVASYSTPTNLGGGTNITYGKTLGDLYGVGQDYYSNSLGTWTFVKPLDTPVGDHGSHTEQLKFVPKNKNYGEAIVDFTYTVTAAPSYAGVPTLYARAGTKVGDVALPEGWAWTQSEINKGISFSYVGGTMTAYAWCSYTSGNYVTGSCALQIHVLKGIRETRIESSYLNNETGIINLPYRYGEDNTILRTTLTNNASYVNTYDIVLRASNDDNNAANAIVMFKGINESDGQYMNYVPTEIGEYMMRVTYQESSKFEEKVITQRVNIVDPVAVYTSVDRTEGTTTVLYSGGYRNDYGRGFVYDYVDKTPEELRNYAPIKTIDWEVDEALTSMSHNTIIVVRDYDTQIIGLYTVNSPTSLTYVELPNMEYYFEMSYENSGDTYVSAFGLYYVPELEIERIIICCEDNILIDYYDPNEIYPFYPEVGTWVEYESGFVILNNFYGMDYIFTTSQDTLKLNCFIPTTYADYAYGEYGETILFNNIEDMCFGFYFDVTVTPDEFNTLTADVLYGAYFFDVMEYNEVTYYHYYDSNYDEHYYYYIDNSHNLIQYFGENIQLEISNMDNAHLGYTDLFGELNDIVFYYDGTNFDFDDIILNEEDGQIHIRTYDPDTHEIAEEYTFFRNDDDTIRLFLGIKVAEAKDTYYHYDIYCKGDVYYWCCYVLDENVTDYSSEQMIIFWATSYDEDRDVYYDEYDEYSIDAEGNAVFTW